MKVPRPAGRHLAPVLRFLMLAALLPVVAAATLVVDDDGTAPYSTIQSAIDAAIPGQDDVHVRCGVYAENITMRDGISVHGESSRCVVIDPLADDLPTVTLNSIASATRLEGFTIRNRHSLWLSSSGILINAGAPVITRNEIRGDGPADYSGPGIEVYGGAPTISYNLITGGYDCCYGGGVVLMESDARVFSNLIVSNAAYYGAGLFVSGGDPEITFNTIARNDAWVGGGLLTYGTGTVANNVIALNTATIYGGGIVEWGLGATVFESNDIFGNTFEEVISDQPVIGADGNISVDPQFLDEHDSFAGFQPRSTSPVIDAASPSWPSATDLRGIPRPLDGDADGLPLSDMGARENEGVTGLVHTGVEFEWDLGRHQPPDFNIYRGDLAVLKSTGVYTQDPSTVEGARHFCDFSNRLGDSDTPTSGQTFFYLPVAWGAVEGSAGFDSRAVERPREMECLGP